MTDRAVVSARGAVQQIIELARQRPPLPRETIVERGVRLLGRVGKRPKIDPALVVATLEAIPKAGAYRRRGQVMAACEQLGISFGHAYRLMREHRARRP
jgi:hypothetical protein